MTSILEEYNRILNFPNDSYKVYFKQRFEDTALKITRLLYLGKVGQFKVADGGLIWKSNKARMKKNMGKKNWEMNDTR